MLTIFCKDSNCSGKGHVCCTTCFQENCEKRCAKSPTTCGFKEERACGNELRLIYNFDDEAFYLYFGEDYITDTRSARLAYDACNLMIRKMKDGKSYAQARSETLEEMDENDD